MERETSSRDSSMRVRETLSHTEPCIVSITIPPPRSRSIRTGCDLCFLRIMIRRRVPPSSNRPDRCECVRGLSTSSRQIPARASSPHAYVL